MGPKRVMWVRRYQGQCRALRPLGHQGYRLRSHNKDQPLCSGYTGGLEFKVRWRGYGPSHDTWEPVSSFVPRVNTPFMEYIRRHKTKIHVSDLAALTRAIAARGA